MDLLKRNNGIAIFMKIAIIFILNCIVLLFVKTMYDRINGIEKQFKSKTQKAITYLLVDHEKEIQVLKKKVDALDKKEYNKKKP